MSKFRVGDKVRRINGDWHGMKVGDVGVVSAAGPARVAVFDVCGTMDVDNLELVESVPVDKESELRAAYVQASKDHAEAIEQALEARRQAQEAQERGHRTAILKQQAKTNFTRYIVEKEVPHVRA